MCALHYNVILMSLYCKLICEKMYFKLRYNTEIQYELSKSITEAPIRCDGCGIAQFTVFNNLLFSAHYVIFRIFPHNLAFST